MHHCILNTSAPLSSSMLSMFRFGFGLKRTLSFYTVICLLVTCWALAASLMSLPSSMLLFCYSLLCTILTFSSPARSLLPPSSSTSISCDTIRVVLLYSRSTLSLPQPISHTPDTHPRTSATAAPSVTPHRPLSYTIASSHLARHYSASSHSPLPRRSMSASSSRFMHCVLRCTTCSLLGLNWAWSGPHV